jgi:predicted NBD/HSP70 family sugar kinase
VAEKRSRSNTQGEGAGTQGEGAKKARDAAAASERAEQVLEQWGSRLGRGVATAAARLREEAEDIWAEAQSVRRGERD